MGGAVAEYPPPGSDTFYHVASELKLAVWCIVDTDFVILAAF